MTAILDVLSDLHTGEQHLASELQRVGQRHEAEQDVFHITRDLACWSEQHTEQLARAAKDRGKDLPDGSHDSNSFGPLREWMSERLLGRHKQPGLLLLLALQGIYLSASYNSLHWEMLAQGAQALSDHGLLEVATSCHPETLRQVRWANTKLKESAPQILSSLSWVTQSETDAVESEGRRGVPTW
jgi:hypothetical protein